MVRNRGTDGQIDRQTDRQKKQHIEMGALPKNVTVRYPKQNT